VDVSGPMKALLIAAGGRVEEGEGRWEALSFPGLAMPLPLAATPGAYPTPEAGLPALARALDKLKGAGPRRPQRFDVEGFDPFQRPDRPTGPRPRGPGDAGLELPDHCLLRVVDLTVRPGEAYQYRLRVRMANPNLGRKDVADPKLAADAELTS